MSKPKIAQIRPFLLSELNTQVSDATLIDTGDSRLSDSRAPTGSAGGDLGGTYPNPTVNDGADSTAIHNNVAGEINSITEKTGTVPGDWVLIEDSADSSNKKKAQLGNLTVTDKDAIHNNVAAEISAITEKTSTVHADLVLIEDSAASNAKKSIKLLNLGTPQVTYEVLKDTVGLINVGELVYTVGYSTVNDIPTVELADGLTESTLPCIGIAATSISDVAKGTIVVKGRLQGINTSSFTTGDLLYVSNTAGVASTTPGKFNQAVARVMYAHATEGELYVLGVDGYLNGAILDNEAGQIAAITEKTTPVSGDLILIEDSAATNAKKKVQIGNLPGGTPVDTFMFRFNGKISVLSKIDVAWIAPRACTITRITLYRRTAGTSGSTIVDVNKNGTTVYTTQGNRPTVTQAGGNDQIDATTDMDVTSVAQNDRIEVDIDAVEAGNPQDLSVIIEVEY